jgi:hypothetical protein
MATVFDVPVRRLASAASASAASASADPSVPSIVPSAWTTSGSDGALPSPGGCGPNAGGGASTGSRVTTARPSPRPSARPSRESRAAVTAASGTNGLISTSMVPPQASPTSHACSSLIP